jgi:polar amino acid transport system substrate-binding protein
VKKFVFTGVLLAMFAVGSYAQSSAPTKLIRLSTLEWPPYNGLLLPQEGLATRIATAVAKTAGYRLLTASFEWSKTVEKGEKDPNFDGYFPEYYSKEREQACHLSQSIGISELGVASLKKSPINWTNISELSAHRLGVVDGYLNGDELDAAIKDKRQPVEVAASDAVNLSKLRDGKLRGIVIDKNVLNYTLFRTGGADSVVFGSRPIARLTLHVCFKRTPAGLEMRNAFDAALKASDISKIEADYIRSITGKN